MKLQILAVGKMKSGPERDLYGRYADRIAKAGRALHLDGPDLIEITESQKADASQRKSEEADELLTRTKAGTRIILLDEDGKSFSSEEFAKLLRREQEAGSQSLGFAIGGADGHGEALQQACVQKISFGKMTWPHQIARILLVEQLYRAITILSGHPYHRE